MLFWITLLLAVLGITITIIWLLNSIKSIGPDEVALKSWFGQLERTIYRSGIVFAPSSLGITFSGRPWCQITRIPKKQMAFSIGGKMEHRVWSKDHQLLLVDISGYLRFPYNDVDSLILLKQAGVPMEEDKLDPWIEEEVISGMRDILADFDHDTVIDRSNLTAIRDRARTFFLDQTGLFFKSGICGSDPNDFTPGQGEVILRVEQVNLTPELQKAIQDPVTARYEAIAAKENAKIEQVLAGDPIRLAMDEWVAGQVIAPETVETAKARLIGNGAYAKHEQIVYNLLLARSGNLQVNQSLIGSPDGGPLPASLTYLSVGGGGGGVGVFAGGGKKGRGDKAGRGKKPQDMTDEEAVNNAFDE